MSSKWTSDDDGKSDTGARSPTSEEKDGSGGGRRSRRPRLGRGSTSAASTASEDASKGEVEKPDIKTRTGGSVQIVFVWRQLQLVLLRTAVS